MGHAAIIETAPKHQRARGKIRLRAGMDQDGISRLKDFRQEGSFRAIFPRPQRGNLETVIINTAGGMTGGDAFSTEIVVSGSARVSVTTQAAERIYRAPADEAASLETTLSVAKAAQLYWLPQETILFDNFALDRKLTAEVAPDATLLMLEPIIFGRAASSETITTGRLEDRVQINLDGVPIYLDRIKMTGDFSRMLTRSAVADGAQAMANLVFVDPYAAKHLDACRALLPQTGGASLLADNVLVLRLLATDSFALRTILLPLLQQLTHNTVPKNWRL